MKLLSFFNKHVNHRRVGQGRDVAQLFGVLSGDLAQDAAHDLSGTGFWQSRRNQDLIRHRDRPDMGADLVAQCTDQFHIGNNPLFENDVGKNPLPLDFVREANHGRFGAVRVGDQGTLDLGGTHPVSGDIDDVVDPAGDPVVAVFVTPASVTGQIVAGVGVEIDLGKALVIPLDGPRNGWPGALDSEQAGNPVAVQFVSLLIEQDRFDTEEGVRRRAGLGRGCPGQRGDQDAAGFGLPPGVDDVAALLADHVVVPLPDLRVDRLADRA